MSHTFASRRVASVAKKQPACGGREATPCFVLLLDEIKKACRVSLACSPTILGIGVCSAAVTRQTTRVRYFVSVSSGCWSIVKSFFRRSRRLTRFLPPWVLGPNKDISFGAGLEQAPPNSGLLMEERAQRPADSQGITLRLYAAIGQCTSGRGLAAPACPLTIAPKRARVVRDGLPSSRSKLRQRPPLSYPGRTPYR